MQVARVSKISSSLRLQHSILRHAFSFSTTTTTNDLSQTPLHIAASNNNVEKIKSLLSLREKLVTNLEEKEKSEKEKKEKEEKKKKKDDFFSFFGRSHFDDPKPKPGKNLPEFLEAKNMYGETPLHIAAKNGCSNAIQLLLEHGASVQAKAKNGTTPLHLAVEYSLPGKDPLPVKTLIDNKADWSVKDDMSQTPLHIAVENNNVEVIKFLLGSRGPGFAKLESSNKRGETPLHIAAKNGYNGALKVLLDHGASMEAKDNNGISPLHLAVCNLQETIIKTLLEYKADPTIKDYDSQTPLHTAAGKNNAEILKSLLDFQGSEKVASEAKKKALETTNGRRETPLHVAAKHGCTESAKVLLEHKAPLEEKDHNGMTPLHLAVWFTLQTDDSSIVKLLLEHNADTNVKDDNGLSVMDLLEQDPDNEKYKELITDIEDHRKDKAVEAFKEKKSKMTEIEEAISNIIGMEDLKEQLTKWAKGMLIDEQRAALGLKTGPRRAPHVAFLGNPGTGKTMVARLLGNILHTAAIIPTDKVVEVQRTDLIGEYVGHTGPKTREKIEEAEGGILFVDEAYRLMPHGESKLDYGREALEEIMSAMESGKVMVIFAGYKDPMKRVIAANEGFARRVTKFFTFTDYTSGELAEIIHLKMNKQKEEDLLYGFKLHENCSLDAIAEMIDNETSKTQREKLNGGLADIVLRNARENLDRRLYAETVDSEDLSKVDKDEVITITLDDIEAAIRSLPKEIQ